MHGRVSSRQWSWRRLARSRVMTLSDNGCSSLLEVGARNARFPQCANCVLPQGLLLERTCQPRRCKRMFVRTYGFRHNTHQRCRARKHILTIAPRMNITPRSAHAPLLHLCNLGLVVPGVPAACCTGCTLVACEVVVLQFEGRRGLDT